jgi:sec-independent protein translocase protein TatA
MAQGRKAHGGQPAMPLTAHQAGNRGPQEKSGVYAMQMGPWQILVIGIVVLVLFGRGKISNLMGEVGKGITSFKKGIKDGSEEIAQDAANEATPSDKDKV